MDGGDGGENDVSSGVETRAGSSVGQFLRYAQEHYDSITHGRHSCGAEITVWSSQEGTA